MAKHNQNIELIIWPTSADRQKDIYLASCFIVKNLEINLFMWYLVAGSNRHTQGTLHVNTAGATSIADVIGQILRSTKLQQVTVS